LDLFSSSTRSPNSFESSENHHINFELPPPLRPLQPDHFNHVFIGDGDHGFRIQKISETHIPKRYGNTFRGSSGSDSNIKLANEEEQARRQNCNKKTNVPVREVNEIYLNDYEDYHDYDDYPNYPDYQDYHDYHGYPDYHEYHDYQADELRSQNEGGFLNNHVAYNNSIEQKQHLTHCEKQVIDNQTREPVNKTREERRELRQIQLLNSVSSFARPPSSFLNSKHSHRNSELQPRLKPKSLSHAYTGAGSSVRHIQEIIEKSRRRENALAEKTVSSRYKNSAYNEKQARRQNYYINRVLTHDENETHVSKAKSLKKDNCKNVEFRNQSKSGLLNTLLFNKELDRLDSSEQNQHLTHDEKQVIYNRAREPVNKMKGQRRELHNTLKQISKHGGHTSEGSRSVKELLSDIEKRLPLLEKQAVEEIFAKMNSASDMNSSKFDFHGLHVDEAKLIARENIAPRLNGAINEQITIVTGRGRHSKNGKSEVKEALEKYFIHDLKMRCENVPGNEGVLAVSAVDR
jgi:hypothetical protein